MTQPLRPSLFIYLAGVQIHRQMKAKRRLWIGIIRRSHREKHDRGDIIELQIEEYDTVRTIYLNPAAAPEPVASILGHSIGRWDGDTLEVETTHANWGHLQGRGILLSDDLRMLERFTLTESGGRLEYELTMTDLYAFTAPVALTKSWVYLPDVRVEPYNCVR